MNSSEAQEHLGIIAAAHQIHWRYEEETDPRRFYLLEVRTIVASTNADGFIVRMRDPLDPGTTLHQYVEDAGTLPSEDAKDWLRAQIQQEAWRQENVPPLERPGPPRWYTNLTEDLEVLL